ncbi:Hypothetical predicted protein [Olea europaea subsp. europaea]|uniref:DUF4378 domain-containing protein n=1 Tax=Olea europaea subsp. europaea TaxID=158383 RepID=A0A8S0R6N8_OLEEU|nr:Hypothetical predicted protein [Olea europaea subsp. europaea]
MVQEKNLEKHIEKQMGCMAGFLQIFDRHQILNGKHLYSPKSLPPPSSVVTSSESGTSAATSPVISMELGKPSQEPPKVSPSEEMRSPAPDLQPKSPLPLHILPFKEGTKSTWKFSKEAPRLSLDSRATTDSKGSLHQKEIRTSTIVCGSAENVMAADSQLNRSPSVIARLMGLEQLPASSNMEHEKKPELRRSASESRVSRDIFHSRFIMDGNNFHLKQPIQSVPNYAVKDNGAFEVTRYVDPFRYVNEVEDRKGLNQGIVNPWTWKTPLHPKSFFDSGDIFPEPKQTVSINGEIEKRLRMRGIDEPSKDLETRKQILEALQLKGLLHSRKPSEQSQISNRNIVYDPSPVVVMKPSRSPMASPTNRKPGNGCSPLNDRNQGIRRNLSIAGEVSPRPERNVRSPTRQARSSSAPARSESNEKRSNSLNKPKPLSVETRSRANESTHNQKLSHIHSPKLNTRKSGSHLTVTNRSPRNKKSTAESHQKEKITAIVMEDESSTVSESTASTSSHTDTERPKMAEHKDGRSLLDRCDKLLNSIAEMNATDSQPSPVSVLDSFESPSPSPITMKRRIDFKDQSGELEEEIWTPVISPMQQAKYEEISEDSDFVYMCDILKASHYLPEGSDIFMLLEKQQYLEGKDTSKVSRLERKLIFDTTNEILDWNRQLPPWKSISWTLENVWSEFQRIRERDTVEDNMFEAICGILKKDLAGDAINRWGDSPVGMSEAVLDIERLIFKDLIGETIQDLALLASKSKLCGMPRKKLVF